MQSFWISLCQARILTIWVYLIRSRSAVPTCDRYLALVHATIGWPYQTTTLWQCHCLCCHQRNKKIAECLSSVDELIAAQGRKLEALKTHKKGLMQQLFPFQEEVQL
jgi:hypothetical protein